MNPGQATDLADVGESAGRCSDQRHDRSHLSGERWSVRTLPHDI
jgi:hypothetical protein